MGLSHDGIVIMREQGTIEMQPLIVACVMGPIGRDSDNDGRVMG